MGAHNFNYLVTNVNAVKTSVLLMEFFERISKAYIITEFRIDALRDFVMKSLRSVLVNLYNPVEVKRQVTDLNIF